MSTEILASGRVPASDDAEPVAGRGRWSAAVGNATIALPPVLWFVLGWNRRWITDDGLIAARTVRQILAGRGPVFNPGERVEANTSALWTWLLAAASWVTQADVYTVIEWTGLILAPAGLLFALLGARNVHRRIGAGGPLVPLGAAVVLALPPFWDFVTSGLETSLIFCWLGLCWWLLSRVPDGGRGRVYAAGAVIGLGWVVRPDMMLMTLAFGAALVLIDRPGRLRAVKLVAVTFAVPGAYEVFRMGYYGLLVPNTALVKEASSSDPGQGLAYLGNFVSPYLLWLPALLITASVPLLLPWSRIARHDRFMVLSAAAGGVLSAAYVVWIGGDFMHARMLLPGTFTLLMPVMAVPLPALAGLRAKLALGAMAVVAVWAVVCLADLRLPQKAVIPNHGSPIANERAFWVLRTGDAHPVNAAPYMKMVVGTGEESLALQRITGSPDPLNHRSLFYQDAKGQMVSLPLRTSYGSIALPGDILGTLGAIVPLDGLAIDTHGLSYAVGSHMLTNGHRIGHEKTTGLSWIIADYTVPGSHPVPVSVSANGPSDPAAEPGVGAAHRALGCGALKSLGQATRSPLTFHLMLRNIVDSFDRTEFRVQNDPALAVGELCGPASP